jgi:hypothetical protein
MGSLDSMVVVVNTGTIIIFIFFLVLAGALFQVRRCERKTIPLHMTSPLHPLKCKVNITSINTTTLTE